MDNKSDNANIFDAEVDTDISLLTCPITGEIMYDPVIASDGNTYERKAIEKMVTRSYNFSNY